MECDRRNWLLATAAGVLASASTARADKTAEPFGYCLNTSTIRGQKLSIVDEIAIAARAGYTGIEPWLNEIEQYQQSGGSLKDLDKRIRDNGLKVESSIAFSEWVVDDDARRKKGLEQFRRHMDTIRQIGCKRIAAPPAGATNQTNLSLARAADRYRELLELGAKMEVVPQVELWGFSKSLRRLGEVMYVAIESNHPQACVLLDIYHLYKGGSGFSGLRFLGPGTMHVIHMNDYPAEPARATVTDAHRVFPGDGVAPLGGILRDLHSIGFRGMLSLELFNRMYWQMDALTAARNGLDKMRALVRDSIK